MGNLNQHWIMVKDRSKIDYVVISSDDNPMYKDFYPIISNRWKDIGLKTYFINITDEDNIIFSKSGIIHKIKKLDFVSTAFQSQVVRLFSSNLLEDSNLLISDIDMLPISRNYFNEIISKFDSLKISICSGQPYNGYPYYPMCYNIANSNILRDILDIKGLSFSDFCRLLIKKYGEVWNADEMFMFDMFQRNTDKLSIYKRDMNRRIDRSKWSYSVERINCEYYIDSHLLRPYSKYKKEINDLIKILT